MTRRLISSVVVVIGMTLIGASQVQAGCTWYANAMHPNYPGTTFKGLYLGDNADTSRLVSAGYYNISTYQDCGSGGGSGTTPPPPQEDCFRVMATFQNVRGEVDLGPVQNGQWSSVNNNYNTLVYYYRYVLVSWRKAPCEGNGGYIPKPTPTPTPTPSGTNYWYAKGSAGEYGPLGTNEATARNTVSALNGKCWKYDRIYVKSGPAAGQSVSIPEPDCTGGYMFKIRIPGTARDSAGRLYFKYYGKWYLAGEYTMGPYQTKSVANSAISNLIRNCSGGANVTKSIYCNACSN